MRFIATLVIVVMAGLPAMFAGWPRSTPVWFASLWHGIPGSIAGMSALMAVFILLAGICGLAARRARAADEGAGR